jgi:carbohydrate kinase (thermoresistant glucokinase family)
MVYVFIGVSGSGKTTIGKKIAKHLNICFFDADDYHSQNNILKMKNGEPLTDSDRASWLLILNQMIHEWNTKGDCVLSCSALKEGYRKLLSENNNVFFIFLDGGYNLIHQRLLERNNHFFNKNLLESQFQCFERPNNCLTVSVDKSVKKICQEVLRIFKKNNV